jgi:hypothetical protein
MEKIIKTWMISFVFTTLVSGVVYIVVQQNYRHAADEPQISMVHDLALDLNQGKLFTASKSIDLSTYQSPFTMIFDKNGNVVTSEGTLNHQSPSLPSGVLEYSLEHGRYRLTWQPQHNVRIAAVIEPYKNGYVLVGRSLEQTEKNELQLEQQILLFWIAANVIMLAAITGIYYKGDKK